MSEHDNDGAPTDPPSDDPEEGAGTEEDALPVKAAAVALDLSRRGLLGFSLGWAGLSFVLPAVLLVWGFAVVLALFAIGESLDQTDGLSATTFGAGYVMGALGVTSLVVLLGALKLYWRTKPDTWWRRGATHPALIPGTVVLFLALLSVALEGGGTDVPDTMTTAALLALWHWVLVLLPLWLLYLVGKWSWKTFNWGSKGPYRAGLLSGVAMGVGMLTTAEWITLPAETDESRELVEELDDFFDDVDRVSSNDGLMDVQHAAFAVVSNAAPARSSTAVQHWPSREVESRSRAPSDPYRNAFGECAEDLARPRHGTSEVDDAVGRLVRKGKDAGLAEDIVSLTLILVCEKYADGRVANVVPYFVAAVTKNARRYHRDDRLVFCEAPAQRWDTWDEPYVTSDLRDADRAFCRLSDSDRTILLLSAEGYSTAELASALNTSQAAARQRLSRARARFREKL